VSEERVPYRVTALSAAYDPITTLPVSVLLHNVRSAYNVGAFFRTADAVRADRIYLAGITPRPSSSKVAKTALGAEETVRWEGIGTSCEVRGARCDVRDAGDVQALLGRLRSQGYEVAAVETSVRAVDLFDWRPSFPLCVVFGHEVDGLPASILDCCDTHVRIPMLGGKHSLNVATAGGVVLYELLREYRALVGITR
jgi:23S rRNA (guanosine2251-2'-O)-methyltransferase